MNYYYPYNPYALCALQSTGPIGPPGPPGAPGPAGLNGSGNLILQSGPLNAILDNSEYVFGSGYFINGINNPQNVGASIVIPSPLTITSFEVSLQGTANQASITDSLTQTYTFQLYQVSVPNTGISVSNLTWTLYQILDL